MKILRLLPAGGLANKKGARDEPDACVHGANKRIRTADLLITNQLLYQLSYIGCLSI